MNAAANNPAPVATLRRPRLATVAWAVLVYNVLVIVWGAFVRATGSGAGCGRHWPTCNGQVVPRPERLETWIEFSHRLTSGLALVAIAALLVLAWRRRPAGHRVRKAAVGALVLVLIEAGIGAALVLFELVADNPSVSRAWVVGAHLVNTFLLLAALTLCALWAGGEPGPRRGAPGHAGRWVGALGAMLLLVGASGGMTALGDTLFPAASLAEGLRQDFSATAHFLVRLRVWHPVLAVATLLVAIVAAAVARGAGPPVLGRRGGLLNALLMAQVAVGVINLGLLAPVPLQLIHLAMADAVWIAYVAFAAAVWGRGQHVQSGEP